MLVGLVFGLYTNRGPGKMGTWVGDNIVFWILLALLGWKVFGPAVHG